MKCPYCTDVENKVIDSRMSKDGNTVRRRRECLSCSRRFTTYERVEQVPLVLIKKEILEKVVRKVRKKVEGVVKLIIYLLLLVHSPLVFLLF